MKIKYECADGTVSEVEVEESIGAVIIEDRRLEDNLSRKERYHCYSLDAAQFEGAEYASEETPEAKMKREMDTERIKEAFVKAVNVVIPEKDELIANTKVMMRTVCDTTELEVERSRLLTESETVAEMVKRIVAENQTAAADQEEYQRRRNELVARYEAAKEGYGRVSDEISERQRKRRVYMRFIGGLQRLNGFCEEFDEELWTTLLDHATVYTKDDIRFTFKVGDEVKVDG